MKKRFLLLASLFVLGGTSYAGTPQDRDIANGSYSDTSIFGSTSTPSAALVYTLAAPSSKNSGGGTYSGRYCFNNLVAELAVGTTGYLIDGSTNVANVNTLIFPGAGLTIPLTYTSPHLEPLCFGFGDSASFVTLGSTGNAFFSYQGFITYGTAGGSITNAGK